MSRMVVRASVGTAAGAAAFALVLLCAQDARSDRGLRAQADDVRLYLPIALLRAGTSDFAPPAPAPPTERP